MFNFRSRKNQVVPLNVPSVIVHSPILRDGHSVFVSRQDSGNASRPKSAPITVSSAKISTSEMSSKNLCANKNAPRDNINFIEKKILLDVSHGRILTSSASSPLLNKRAGGELGMLSSSMSCPLFVSHTKTSNQC